jgi:sporulation protein YlmC with PRC-barrel domain
MLKTLSLSAATAAFLATGALAQGTQPTPPAQPATPPAVTAPAPDTGTGASSTTSTTTRTESVNFKSSMGAGELRASQLTGMDVRNAAGEDLGDINDLILDTSGKPSVAIIGVGGFLGLGEKNVGVPFSSLTIATASDGKNVARLDVTKESLTAAPKFVYNDAMTTGSTTTTNTAPKTQ